MTKPKRTIRYRSARTGAIHNTKEDAIRDNWLYLNNPSFRIGVKQNTVKQNSELELPFIKEKKITLSNAGLATGAILSTNMLDSIAKYANKVGLPVKTALGLATKESTLGNPTDDRSTHKIIKPKDRRFFQHFGQHINKYDDAVNSRFLINYYKDNDNPYTVLLNAARNSKDYEGTLLRGERYADKLAKQKQGREKTNVLEAGLRFYKEHPNQYNPGQHNYQQLVNKRADEVWNSPEIQDWYKRSLEDDRTQKKEGGSIHIAPSKRGTFTLAAKRRNLGVQEFANKVLSNKEDYSSAMIKKANFARNARKWNH